MGTFPGLVPSHAASMHHNFSCAAATFWYVNCFAYGKKGNKIALFCTNFNASGVVQPGDEMVLLKHCGLEQRKNAG